MQPGSGAWTATARQHSSTVQLDRNSLTGQLDLQLDRQLDNAARQRSSTTHLDNAARQRTLARKALPTSGLAASARSGARQRVPRRENDGRGRSRPAALPACDRLEQVAGVQRPRRPWLAASKGERQHVSRAPAQRAATNVARVRQTTRRPEGSRKHRCVKRRATKAGVGSAAAWRVTLLTRHGRRTACPARPHPRLSPATATTRTQLFSS